MAIYDFEGHEHINTGEHRDYTGKWRYLHGLPFTGTNLQNSIVSFDDYLGVVGEDSDKKKYIYYFDVQAEKWYDKEGEIPCSVYNPDECSSVELLCKC